MSCRGRDMASLGYSETHATAHEEELVRIKSAKGRICGEYPGGSPCSRPLIAPGKRTSATRRRHVPDSIHSSPRQRRSICSLSMLCLTPELLNSWFIWV